MPSLRPFENLNAHLLSLLFRAPLLLLLLLVALPPLPSHTKQAIAADPAGDGDLDIDGAPVNNVRRIGFFDFFPSFFVFSIDALIATCFDLLFNLFFSQASTSTHRHHNNDNNNSSPSSARSSTPPSTPPRRSSASTTARASSPSSTGATTTTRPPRARAAAPRRAAPRGSPGPTSACTATSAPSTAPDPWSPSTSGP